MHGNARLTPLVRAEIAHDVLIKRMTIRAAAAARMVSERTDRRWAQRAKEEGLGTRHFLHAPAYRSTSPGAHRSSMNVWLLSFAATGARTPKSLCWFQSPRPRCHESCVVVA